MNNALIFPQVPASPKRRSEPAAGAKNGQFASKIASKQEGKSGFQ